MIILHIYMILGFVYTYFQMKHSTQASFRTIIDAITTVISVLIIFWLWPFVIVIAYRNGTVK